MIENFDKCLAVTLPHEGGWADHPKDPGGATMKGVTLAVFRAYRPGATKDDLRKISDADLRKIYRDGYWCQVLGDSLPAGVDLATFDYAVNSGPGRAMKGLQGAVGAARDGRPGPATMRAIKAADPVAVVKHICAGRLSFMRGLKIWSTFGKGWARRVADVEAKGVAMAVAGKPGAKMVLRGEAQLASGLSTKQNAGANAAAGSGVGGGFAVADVNWLIVGGVLLAALAIYALVKSRAGLNKMRAEAYLEAMKGVDAGAK